MSGDTDEFDPDLEWIACCEHCGCDPSQRLGHDDTCAHGCNDDPAVSCLGDGKESQT